ncbi:MAG: VOC family protein [Bacteroidota bacterium]|nr:VOC family protein [Bacteroidota bacterium]
MKRVTSLGGVFFKCKNPDEIKSWYSTHLGIEMDAYGTSFEWTHSEDSAKKGFTAWSPFKDSTDYFLPSEKEFMINFRVENMEWLLEELKKEGIQIIGEVQVFEYGKFAHIMDPEGNKIELWEANDEVYDKMIQVRTK